MIGTYVWTVDLPDFTPYEVPLWAAREWHE